MLLSFWSSRPEVFCKKGALENFTKFTGKHLYQSLFFKKVAGLSPATLLKKRLWHRCFPLNVVKSLRFFFIEHLRWLFLLVSEDKAPIQTISNQLLGKNVNHRRANIRPHVATNEFPEQKHTFQRYIILLGKQSYRNGTNFKTCKSNNVSAFSN